MHSSDEALFQVGETALRRLLDKLQIAAYICDANGLITYFNSTAAALWGRLPKLNDPIDKYCGSLKLFSASDGLPVPHNRCWMAMALLDNREYNGMEIVVERPDGQRLTALAFANPLRDDKGKLRAAVNVLVDITQRKQAERDMIALKDELAAQLGDIRRLHEMSVRLSNTLELQPILDETLRTAATVEGTDLGVLSVGDAEQNHLEVGAILGFDEEFRNAIPRVPAGSGACGLAFQERRRVIVEDVQTDPIFVDYRDTARRGGFRAVHSTPLVTRDGRVVGVLSTHFRQPHRPSDRQIHVIDVLARQAVDFIENARLYKQLREADRAKDEFLATLAHELRNPLAPLRNALQIIQSTGPADPQTQWAIQVMERQMGQITRLVDDLLDVARITRNKLELRCERVELATVLKVAVEISQPQLDAAEHQFTIDVPAAPLVVDADVTRLAQAVSNLLNNAAKYTPARGRIALLVERQGSDAVVTVRDNGAGIPTALLPRVFDMFVQVKGATGGLGIGLTLVRRLVELHGGSVEARSEGLGKGSEFVIRLPIVIQPSRPGPRPQKQPATTQTAIPRRILVVDDNRDSANSLTMLLKLRGNQVRTAYDGQAAVEIAGDFQPDVILADIGMPRLNGYDAAAHIRQQPWGKDSTLIAISGWGQESDKQRAKEAGFDHHIVKPVDFKALLDLIADLPSDPSTSTTA